MSTTQRRRLRGVYLVKFYGPFNAFVGGTRLSVEQPVDENLKKYADAFSKLNPHMRIRRFTAKFETVKDETGRN